MNAPLDATAILSRLDEGGYVPPEAAVFGEWDTPNLGDRGIHDGVLRFLAECGWRARSYGISTLRPVPADAAHRPASAAAGDAMGGLLARTPLLKRALRGARQRVRVAALSPQLAASQGLLVGGGALLSDANLHFPQSLVRLADCARRLGKPLLCLGCSAEGEWSPRGERMIREFLSACSVVAVRDEVTAARVARLLGAVPPVIGDFCMTESLVHDGRWRGPDGREIAINVCQLPGPWEAAQDRYEDAVVALANRLARSMGVRRAGIRVFTTGLPQDAAAARRVYARIEAAGTQLYLPGNLAQLSALLCTSAAVVATRLHAAVLALVERVPVVGFSVAPKLRDFLATLNIRRYGHAVDDWPWLAEWLARADYGALFADQHRALVRAPVWAARARVRDELRILAGAAPCT